MIGVHPVQAWSSTQGAVAPSSAEAELYGMVEGVTRAKGLMTIAWEVGFRSISNVVHLGTDSSAAKGMALRQGLGKMKHLQAKYLWQQQLL